MAKKAYLLFFIIIYNFLLIGLFFFTAEFLLRYAGIGQATLLFATSPKLPDTDFVVNPDFYAAYFPPENHEGFRNTFLWDLRIPKKKSPEAMRIFVFGGSVALGDVPDVAFSFPRILQCMLREAFPTVNFEVYNLACFALNSHVMRLAAQEAALTDPDLFIVYMGNNEYIGPYGPAWYLDGVPPRTRSIRTQEWLRRFNLFNIINTAFVRRGESLPDDAILLYNQALKLHPDAHGREVMYHNFKENLNAICQSATNAHAGVVLCTVGNNLKDIPPFFSLHTPSLSNEAVTAWEAHYRLGISLQGDSGAGNAQSALATFQKALDIDSTYADLLYRSGQCALQVNDTKTAHSYFVAARDADAFPIRADTRINNVIRNTALEWQDEDIFLADAELLFALKSSNGIMDYDYFYDAVHVLFAGNYLIASSVFDAANEYIGSKTGTVKPLAKLSIEECEKRLGLSPLLKTKYMHKILKKMSDYQGLNTNVDIAPLQEQYDFLAASSNNESLEDAILKLTDALSYWGQDFHIQRIIVELLSEFDRVDEATRHLHLLKRAFPDMWSAQRMNLPGVGELTFEAIFNRRISGSLLQNFSTYQE